MIQLEYKINGAGWAAGKIGNGSKLVDFTASYLHDSLKELAESAIEIRKNNSTYVVFMDEPGEHVLVLNRKDKDIIYYEFKYYEDWWSWNLIDKNNFFSVLKGQTTVSEYVNQVKKVLNEIMTELSFEEYRLSLIHI